MPRPVIAAVPVYNMAPSLANLLPQLLAQGYDAVYVLDDHSTDNTVATAKKFKGVTVISGSRNAGAGPNRNRILQVADTWPQAIIHFVDADISLESQHIPAALRRIFEDPKIGIAGGLVYEKNGLQSPYNFGPRISFAWIGALIPQLTASQRAVKAPHNHIGRPPKGRAAWPNVFLKPQAQDVFYVLEGNMAVPMALLKRLGGFHPTMRFNEAQDLGNKIAALGLKCRFDPSFAVMHHAVKVQGRMRALRGIGSSFHMLHKNGWPLQ